MASTSVPYMAQRFKDFTRGGNEFLYITKSLDTIPDHVKSLFQADGSYDIAKLLQVALEWHVGNAGVYIDIMTADNKIPALYVGMSYVGLEDRTEQHLDPRIRARSPHTIHYQYIDSEKDV
jgi:hypothetical protein